MGVAKFNADVTAVGKKAAAGTIPGITSVVSSTVHGQVVITISHKSLSKDVKIRATCEDPTDYPDETSFSLSVPHATPSHVGDAVKSTQNFLVGMRLYEVVLALSTSLQTALDSEEEHQDEAAEDSDDGDYDDWSDGQFGVPRNNSAPGTSRESHPKSQRMRLDLRQVRNAGYKVGFLSDTAKVGNGGTVSLSIRINKLGLSQDLMEAWDVESTDYFVLLIRFGSSYSTLDAIIERPAEGMQMSFRVGKCSFYKPSPEQAALAFLRETDRRTTSEARESTEGPDYSATTTPDTSFRKLFLSNSLDQYLNQNLIRLIKIRDRDGCTWDAANETHRQQYASTHRNAGAGPNSSLPGPGRARSLPGAAHLLGQDHWRDAGRRGSFPLVAMQFAMRNFMKCNSFCLVCHRTVDGDEIEALRPYVCLDSLCLFQYLSMGFGPSIEHEILTQPLVVDLLVSLCYAALVPKDGDGMLATSRGPPPLRDLPVGLQLRVPNIFSNMVKPLRGEVDCLNTVNSTIPPNSDDRLPGTLLVPPTSLSLGTKLHTGQWIAFQRATDRVLHHAQIIDIVGQKVYVEVAASSFVDRPDDLSHLQTAGVQYTMNRTGATGTTATYGAPRISGGDPNDVEIFFYDADFDSLGDANTKIEAMRLILDTLPSVRDMAAYLRNHPGCTLRTMPKATPAASSLLAWIISSNRSCIYQIDRSLPRIYNGQTETQSTVQASGQQYPEAGTAAGLALPPSTSVGEAMVCGRDREQERIGGMDGWVQFRFAQGSPDKELRFKQALQAEASLTGVKGCPTLLAWHGSPVSNWHSILRTGLNFETLANGRAYGNGVYFSPHYQTSHGYCGNRATLRWKNSELAVQSCVSLNEIINAPTKWVSCKPHYVVAQPDWHQCRYLFVERTVGPGSEAALMQSATAPTGPKAPPKLFPQEVGWEILGPSHAPLTVPLSAIPTGRKLQTKPSSFSKRKSPKSLDSDEEDEEDRVLLFSDSEGHGVDSSYRSRKRRSHSLASNSTVSQHGDAYQAGPMNGASSAQMTKRPVTVDKKMTDFEPDSLDLATLPRLSEPSFSNNIALRALGRELSKLQSIQARTPLHELGWYLHAEAVTNLFQWIAELHSFDASLPLAKDMKALGIRSIVLEIRFPGDFPMSPPFVRVVRPRFLPFFMGGGGHVTGGGAMCMELLTTTGWSPAYSMESVLVQVRLAMTNLEPRPGRIWDAVQKYGAGSSDYGVGEAIEAYQRAVRAHGWTAPANLVTTAHGT
ncbi:hypothetical protein B0T18DRAFT_393660 [Schizothecium vesticola]|uniref:UBC core domain-containing protein n=1 Tax=Schizothecium vesticola TaxID=314040 RepID=A0AA40JZS6_9PEZI|nr:hypothetical protein B0T18DRAFT_393660 [Schizothecium vesticola]